MRTALAGNLVMRFKFHHGGRFDDSDWIHNELNNDFTRLNCQTKWEGEGEKKFARLEAAEKIDKSKREHVLAKSSHIIRVPASLHDFKFAKSHLACSQARSTRLLFELETIMENHCFGDIIFEILSRLPAKSLMRFNCVCKTWNSLIRDDPNFVQSHIARSQAPPTATRLLFDLYYHDNKRDVAVKENKKRRIEGFPLELQEPRHYFNYEKMRTCSNHCNGLICLYNVEDTRVYLLNVTTGEIKALSFSVNDVKSPLYPPRLCLGFDLVMEKYKLLQLFVEYNNNKLVTKMRIRTLGRDSYWRNCCHMSSTVSPLRSNFLNGVLYWVHCPCSRIFYFDLTKEELQSFSLPEEYSHFAVLDSMQTALRGKLVMHCFNTEINFSNYIYDELVKPKKVEENNPPLIENFKEENSYRENFVKRSRERKILFCIT
ncbi:hypothetical protein FXO37_05399 [Capsicum annuum]|nr:hypothetical protein FXO37_05399 [Capsicum annuum]